MDKFGRSYVLSIEARDGRTIRIEPPFTLEFDIDRNILSSANTSSIRIFNLSENTRKDIHKDPFESDLIKRIELRAGYGTNLPIVFKGNIQQAFSVREGSNYITKIESFDGGVAFANGLTLKSFPAGALVSDIINTLLGSLPTVERGSIGNYSGTLSRGNVFSGSTVSLLNEISSGGFFIDNSRAHCLGDDECLLGDIAVINSASGLLSTPTRYETYLTFDMLFEPRLSIGQKVRLESITAKNFNMDYKVVSVKHKGIISEAVGGNATTNVGLFCGTEVFRLVGR